MWEDEIEPLLRNDPTGKLKATTIIDWLAEQHPGRFSASQLRTRPVALLSSITQRHNYSGQRGYHPLLAVAAGTGEVLMARLRKGRANTARGAAHFLRETVGRVRHAGATGPLTVRADSGFYTYAIVAVCRDKDVRFSITVRHRPRLRNLIEAIPEEDWTPIPYWMEGAADVARPRLYPSRASPTPRRCGSWYAGSSPRPAPNWRCLPATAITPSSPTGTEIPWISRPTIAATPRSRTPSAT